MYLYNTSNAKLYLCNESCEWRWVHLSTIIWRAINQMPFIIMYSFRVIVCLSWSKKFGSAGTNPSSTYIIIGNNSTSLYSGQFLYTLVMSFQCCQQCRYLQLIVCIVSLYDERVNVYCRVHVAHFLLVIPIISGCHASLFHNLIDGESCWCGDWLTVCCDCHSSPVSSGVHHKMSAWYDEINGTDKPVWGCHWYI